MNFHQIVVTAAPGDAITNQAFEIDALMSGVSNSGIFALNIHPDVADRVQPLHALRHSNDANMANDLILFHVSIGSPTVTNFVLQRPERLMISYHNISPAEPFLGFDPAFAGLLASGRTELASLVTRCEFAITESHYNAKELIDLGFSDVRVVPLIIDLSALKSVEPSEGTLNHFRQVVTGPVLLFVGQLLPHKRPDLLLEAYYALSTSILPEANLVMVGAPRLPLYRDYLQDFIYELNMKNAGIFGAATDAELVALFNVADAFVTLSEHEGYCVPLVEAMGFDLPIVARDCGAVGETLGGAGVLLPPEPDPLLAAEAMAEVLTNDALRQELITLGRARHDEINPDLARAQTLDAILEVAAP